MSIDNFALIKPLLIFDSEDDFYFSQVLQRKKENPEIGSNSHVCKTYYIRSGSDLDYYRGEMICLADFHNARVCINLNRRSFEKTAFHTLKKVTDQIMNKDFKQVRKAYNSVCGTYLAETDKKWILDFDIPYDKDFIIQLNTNLFMCKPEGNKILNVIYTKNGYHVITSPFNIQQFSFEHPVTWKMFELHKNNPTILYIP